MNLNKALKQTRAHLMIAQMDEIEKGCPFKVGQSVTVKRQIPTSYRSMKDYEKRSPSMFRLVPAVVVDVISKEKDMIELRVAPKLRNERVGNPFIRFFCSDQDRTQVFI